MNVNTYTFEMTTTQNNGNSATKPQKKRAKVKVFVKNKKYNEPEGNFIEKLQKKYEEVSTYLVLT